jgi:Rrf2 family protein
MIFSTAAEYAIRGLSELALRAAASGGAPVLLDDLVAGTSLPRDFLAKLFQKVVRAGILRSARGRGGGFTLARPAHEITLMQICDAVDEDRRRGPDQCVVGLAACNDAMACPQHDLYKPIRQRLKDYLNTTTLADLATSLKAKLALQQQQHQQRGAGRKEKGSA